MAQIGAFEILGTVLLIALAVVVVLLFIVIGWFVVWKLILSHFRFFREILGMDNSDEETEINDKKSSKMPDLSPKSYSSATTPAHIRRRQQREAENLMRDTVASVGQKK